jgi:hypothetical protein
MLKINSHDMTYRNVVKFHLLVFEMIKIEDITKTNLCMSEEQISYFIAKTQTHIHYTTKKLGYFSTDVEYQISVWFHLI